MKFREYLSLKEEGEPTSGGVPSDDVSSEGGTSSSQSISLNKKKLGDMDKRKKKKKKRKMYKDPTLARDDA